jgi:ankyrin repeat protein
MFVWQGPDVDQESICNFVQNKADIPLMEKMLKSKEIPDINIRDCTWRQGTALMYQAQYGTVESLEFLLKCDPPADMNLTNILGLSALHFAVLDSSPDKPEKVRLLLKYGAETAAFRAHIDAEEKGLQSNQIEKHS